MKINVIVVFTTLLYHFTITFNYAINLGKQTFIFYFDFAMVLPKLLDYKYK